MILFILKNFMTIYFFYDVEKRIKKISTKIKLGFLTTYLMDSLSCIRPESERTSP